MIDIYRRCKSILFLRKKILRGSALAIAFLVVESIGFLLLVHTVSSNQGTARAGQISLLLYLLTFVGVMFMSLGVVVSREITRWNSHSGPQVRRRKWHSILVTERLVIGAALFILSASLFGLVLIRTVDLTLGSAVLILSGFLLRGFGLLSAFKRVGLGDIGADKGYALLFSFVFYLAAITLLESKILEQNAVPLAYALAGLVGFITETRLSTVFVSFLDTEETFNSSHLTAFDWQSSEQRNLWVQYFSMLVIAAAGFLVTSGDAFIVSSVFGSEALASYSVAAKLSLGVFAVASIYPSMQFQPIADNFSRGDIKRCRKYWLEGLFVALFVSAIASVMLHFVYSSVAEWVTGNPGALNDRIFSLLCLSATVMVVTSACGWAIMGGGGAATLPKPTLIDSALTMVLGYGGGSMFGFGGLLWGMILAHSVSAGLHFFIASRLFISHDI